MQRWIAIGLVGIMLFLGGSYFAYRTYKQNRPHPVWVPLLIKADLETTKRDEVIKNIKEMLSNKEVLLKVSKDLGLPKKLKLDTDEQCANEIASRLFVKPGSAETAMGSAPAIHIGVEGKEKDSALSAEIAMRLMEDVWKYLGIRPPTKQES